MFIGLACARTRNAQHFPDNPQHPKGKALTPLPTEIRVEDAGATERTIALTGDWRRDVTTALNHEHGDCEDASCDIREALEQDFPLIAASLLSGATETPVLDAVRHAYEDADAIPEGEGFGDMAATPEWEGWTNHFDEFARKCEACGSYTFATEYDEPEECANCRASLMREVVMRATLTLNVRPGDTPNDALETYVAENDITTAFEVVDD